MPRNLDLTALRSFATVAEAGGVTRAAGILNLTQSAVSMQLKRLEDSLDTALLDRSSRTIALTAAGEQLLGYAQRMLNLNDEIYARLTAQEFEGELRLGAPHDIIYPRIPNILRRVAKDFPRVQIKLISAPTRRLLDMFGRGEVDIILTTEEQPGPGGESLITLPLVWVGAENGTAWKRSPLPLASCSNCIFRPIYLRALDDAGIPWEMTVDTDRDSAVEAAISADLGVHAGLADALPRQTEVVQHGGALPDLGEMRINMYIQRKEAPVDDAIADIIRQAHQAPQLPKLVTV